VAMKHLPPPSPLGVAAADADVAIAVKVAVTDVAAVIVMVQVPVPEHPPPDQPEKVDPLFDEAVKDTDVPEAKLAEQVESQLIREGLLVTIPEPDGETLTVKTYEGYS